MSKGEKIVFGVLGVLNLLFLVYWFGISINYRMHYDDVHFMADLQDVSIWEFVKMRYMDVGGNFGTYFENGIVDRIALLVGDYRLWPMVFYGLGIWMSYAVAKYHIKNVKPAMLFMSVVAIYNIYVLTAIDLSVFTWLCAMAYYLFGPMLLLLLSYLNRDKIEWWRWGVSGVIAFYIAGASVSFSPVAMSVLFINGMWLWWKHGWRVKDTWADVRVRRIVYVAIAMVLLLIVVVVAPGNYARMGGSEMAKAQTIPAFLWGIVHAMTIYSYLMAFYLPYHLLVLCLGVYIGMRSNNVLRIEKKKLILIMIGAFIVYLLISSLPMSYLYSGFGIQRPYTHVCYMYALLMAAIGYVIGIGMKESKVLHVCTTGLAAMMIVIMCVNVYLDLPIAHAYAKAHDERKAYLLELRDSGNTETVYVTPYPSAKVLDAKYVILRALGKSCPQQSLYCVSDAGLAPNEYEGHVRNYLDLDFDFVFPKTEEETCR